MGWVGGVVAVAAPPGTVGFGRVLALLVAVVVGSPVFVAAVGVGLLDGSPGVVAGGGGAAEAIGVETTVGGRLVEAGSLRSNA